MKWLHALAVLCLLVANVPAQDTTEKKEVLPLKTSRKVEFATSEGTWMSLDDRETARASFSSSLAIFTPFPWRAAKRSCGWATATVRKRLDG